MTFNISELSVLGVLCFASGMCAMRAWNILEKHLARRVARGKIRNWL